MKNKWVVLKFGGTSVATAKRWCTIRDVARERVRAGYRVLIVCSAVTKISDKLDELVEKAKIGEHPDCLDVIRTRHQQLCDDLGLKEGLACVRPEFDHLGRLCTGLSLIEQANPRIRAHIMSFGEVLATKLGHAWLRQNDLDVRWLNAKDFLLSRQNPSESWNEHQAYLSATCDSKFSKSLRDALDAYPEQVLITQGFVAGNAAGEFVLLGRGGSDISASYFGAKIGAERVEIWTDVPGMFTTNPAKIPNARLLTTLEYDEAQELASSGAKVLHPRCVEPCKTAGIPLHIRWTERPDVAGTVIQAQTTDHVATVKAVISKGGVYVISMDSIGMWQEVGFLAKVFACFKKKGLSIDMIATSQTNVTVTLDPIANYLDADVIRNLTNDLEKFCKVTKIGPCATVSLVGKNIRAIFPKLGPAFEVFSDKKIHLVSQSASDLNFTFAVEQDEATRIEARLHSLLFGNSSEQDFLGKTWSEFHTTADAEHSAKLATFTKHWWAGRRDELLALANTESPRYVYDLDTLRSAVTTLQSIAGVARINYAVKANPYAPIIKLFADCGLSFDCVSLAEIEHVRSVAPDLEVKQILFTPNFAPLSEYAAAFALGCTVTVDNVSLLENHPDLFRGKHVFIRIDPDTPSGHHRFVQTAGKQSKFGIAQDQISRVLTLARELGIRIVGLHAHVGSGIFSPETWANTALILAQIAHAFPDVRVIDVGGGFGVIDRLDRNPLDVSSVSASIAAFKAAHPQFELWIEPGRFLVALAGVLLTRVTQIKHKQGKVFVGLDTGMNSLIRYPLYGAYHEIVNLTRLQDLPAIHADIVGPICESGDIFGHDRSLPATGEGDVILIATAGAYSRAMSSTYNLRQPAAEVCI